MKNDIKKEVKILGIIPARGGSTRVPRKNIADVGGKPLIYYTIREAQKSKLLDAFLVSTDDKEIADIAKSFGADVPFLRPKKYATKYAKEINFLQHALSWVEKNRGWHPDVMVIMRPTSPLRTASDIDMTIETLLKSKCGLIKTVNKISQHPFRMWQFEKDGITMKQVAAHLVDAKRVGVYGTDFPSQLLPKIVWQNAAVDAIRVKYVKMGNVFAGSVGGVVMDSNKSVDIDHPEDLIPLGKILKNKGK